MEVGAGKGLQLELQSAGFSHTDRPAGRGLSHELRSVVAMDPRPGSAEILRRQDEPRSGGTSILAVVAHWIRVVVSLEAPQKRNVLVLNAGSIGSPEEGCSGPECRPQKLAKEG